MREVYRVKDTRRDRTVALTLPPEYLTAAPEGVPLTVFCPVTKPSDISLILSDVRSCSAPPGGLNRNLR